MTGSWVKGKQGSVCLCNLLEVQNYFKIQSGRKDAVSSGKKAASRGRSKRSSMPARRAGDRATCLLDNTRWSLSHRTAHGGALPSQGTQPPFPWTVDAVAEPMRRKARGSRPRSADSAAANLST